MVVYITGRGTVQNIIKKQPTIADVTTEVVDGNYDADTATVINDIRTKFDTLLSQLEANGIFASS